MTRRPRLRAAYLTLSTAVLVLLLKLAAYWFTGSVALLSDAAESIVNVAAGLAVILSVRMALQPPDYEHPYGHQKAEYVSSAFEGTLILLAAGMILTTGLQRLFNPAGLSHIGMGLSLAVVASLFNGGTSLYLHRVARRTGSAALAANSRHLLTDVWTSLGVVLAVVLIALSGWTFFDPLIAVVVALNIVREGWHVLTRSLSSLLDVRLPEEEERKILDVLDHHPQVLGYHRLRSRQSGSSRFAEVDIFVHPGMSVDGAHEVVAHIEDDIIRRIPGLVTTIHVEPFLEGRRDAAVSPRDEYPGR